MLNFFPIQWLALLAYAILRWCVGAVLITLGVRHLRLRHEIAATAHLPLFPFPYAAVLLVALCELIAGALIFAGFATQLGALLLVLLSLKLAVWRHRIPHPALPSRLVWFLLIGCGLSLFITGAGALAIDLPI